MVLPRNDWERFQQVSQCKECRMPIAILSDFVIKTGNKQLEIRDQVRTLQAFNTPFNRTINHQPSTTGQSVASSFEGPAAICQARH